MESFSLKELISQFESLNEQQAWAIANQTFLCCRDHFSRSQSLLLSQPEHLFLTRDGHVHPRSLREDRDSSRELARSASRLLSSFGVLLFKALDFGLREDEERRLSRPLEALIESLTNCETEDEGIEEENDFNLFDAFLQKCASRDTCAHYQLVVRALVLEGIELKTFLEKISFSKEKNTDSAPFDALVTSDWAKLWIQVVKEMREGVHLSHVPREDASRAEYSLTPFEMLLNDIKLKNYNLNHVKTEVDRDLPQRLKKDAHALILEFIRSRPPLAPASRRLLAPKPENQISVYERLMQSIRQKDNKLRLKPTETRVKWGSDVGLASHSQPLEEAEAKSLTPGAPRRRLIKANLNLNLSTSFDDSDNDNDTDDKHDNRDDISDDKNVQTRRRFSLRNLSLRLLNDSRRHSMVDDTTTTTTIDVNEDARNHVATIWEASEWGRALECLSLTLQEVKHIRSVLTKAELETLAVTKELREDLQSQRICFTCLKTRFSFFGARPNTCKVCERAICDRCATRMHIPQESFDKVPIYMLSPTPSPPDPPDLKWEAKESQKPQMETKKSVLTKIMRKDVVLVDSGLRKRAPLVRVCRDCKRLVRHLIDTGSAAY